MLLLTRWLGSFAVACLIWPDALAQTPASPATSGSGIVRDLLTSLWAYDRDGRPSKKRVLGFELPEPLLNFYLVESLTSTPRPMVDSLQVQLLSENRCRITARLDFDALWKQYPTLFSAKEREIFHGSKSLRVEVQFSVRSGCFRLKFKPLPAEVCPSDALLSEIIRQLAASQPEKFDTRHPIPIPFGLSRVWTDDGILKGST